MAFANETIRSAVRGVALEFVQKIRPDEVSFFPIIWDPFARSWSINGQVPSCRKYHSFLREVGMAFDGEATPPLIAPFAIATAASVFIELSQRKANPTLDQVKAAVRAAAKAYGAPEKMAVELVERMPEMLWQAFAQAQWPHDAWGRSATIDAAPSDQRNQSVFVATLENGKLSPVRLKDYSEAAKVAEQREYVIVVDEQQGRVRLPVERVLEDGTKTNYYVINLLRPTHRRILWLILKFAGGCFTHDDILNLCHRRKAYERGWIYQYPVELGNLIGDDLKAVILRTGRNRAYEVSIRGWSFCWLRHHESPDSSTLIPSVDD